MKKLSLVLLGALATAHVTQASPGSFNGFYLGGQLGWVRNSVKTNFPSIVWNQQIKDSAVSKTNTSNGLTYGIYGGYGQNNGGFYWGGEFSIEHDTARVSSAYDIEVKDQGTVTKLYPTKLQTKYQRGVVFGITPRIGAVIANENLLYVKLGMEMSRDKFEAYHEWKTVDAAGAQVGSTTWTRVSRSKRQFVFVPGFGYERAFGKLLARVEYGYNFGAKVTTPNMVNAAETKDTPAKLKYSAHLIKVGLAYKF